MLNRKEFLTGIASVTATLILVACGGDDDNGAPAGGGDGSCSDDFDATIANNHGHTLSIPPADFDGGQTISYSIKGTSSHDHTVRLTAENFTDLKNGKSIAVESTSTGTDHTHSLQIVC